MSKTTEPRLERRPEMHYAALRLQVGIPFGELIPPAHDEVLAWLTQKGVQPAGAPFIRYLTTDMSRKLDIEVGWPVAAPLSGDQRMATGTIPAGLFAVMLYTGPYSGNGLYNATTALLEWAEQNGIHWKNPMIDGVETWAARFEHYLTEPAEVPDENQWETELAFMTEEA